MRITRVAGLLATTALLLNAATAAGSALAKLDKGTPVEVTGQWNPGEQVFVATRIEKRPAGRNPSARGAIEALDRGAARFTLYGREIQVDEATVFAADSGAKEGRFDDLVPGMRVEVSADPDSAGTWKATKVAWGAGVKASDKVKGTITEVDVAADTVQTIQISGLEIRVSRATGLKTDYLEAELLGTLFSDEGDANAPHLRVGRMRLAGYVRTTNYRDDGYTLAGADDDTLIGQPAMAVQVAGDWARPLQTMVDFRMSSDQGWANHQFDATNVRTELLQAYATLRTPQARGFLLNVGKQRVRDQREWLFDEYLDAVRLYLTVTRPLVLEASYLPSVFVSASEKFSTWDDLLLRARLIPDARNEATVYWLKRRDSSSRRRQPVYVGLSYSGRPARWLRGWLEAAHLGGEDKGKPQQAYAFDAGATFTSTAGRVRPALTLAYALGSGEEKKKPGSQEFRQTGYEDNTGRFGGFSSFQYYGEVLDPELANIEILTAGAGLRFGYKASVDAVVHVYRQQQPDKGLRAALLLQGAPNGKSRDLGREEDIILGVQNIFKRASASYAVGLFEPGQALNATDRLATRHRVSLRVGF